MHARLDQTADEAAEQLRPQPEKEFLCETLRLPGSSPAAPSAWSQTSGTQPPAAATASVSQPAAAEVATAIAETSATEPPCEQPTANAGGGLATAPATWGVELEEYVECLAVDVARQRLAAGDLAGALKVVDCSGSAAAETGGTQELSGIPRPPH